MIDLDDPTTRWRFRYAALIGMLIGAVLSSGTIYRTLMVISVDPAQRWPDIGYVLGILAAWSVPAVLIAWVGIY